MKSDIALFFTKYRSYQRGFFTYSFAWLIEMIVENDIRDWRINNANEIAEVACRNIFD